MGFSGGGANILKPHTHDSNVLQDGGSLDFDNITQSSMSASSMTYSDGVHLQELAIGSTGDQMVVQGGVPTWSPHGDYPVLEVLASYTGSTSNTTITLPTAANLETVYSEIWIIANLNTNTTSGFGDTILVPNSLGSGYSNTYGYSFDGTTFTNILRVATSYHLLADASLTAASSGLHTVTKISLVKTAATVNTISMKTDSISDQVISEHFESTMDLGSNLLSNIQYQASSASWATGSTITIYGVKF